MTPVLQERGLQQEEYAPGTLREKLAGGGAGPRLKDSHPGAKVRWRGDGAPLAAREPEVVS